MKVMSRLNKLQYLERITEVTEENIAKYYCIVAALYEECAYSDALKGFKRLNAYNGDFFFYLVPYIERCDFLLKTAPKEKEVKSLSVFHKLGFVKENITKAFSKNTIRCKHCGQWTYSEFEHRQFDYCAHCSSEQPALSIRSDSWEEMELKEASSKFFNKMVQEHPVEYEEWKKLKTILIENQAIKSSEMNNWIDYQIKVLRHIQGTSWYRQAISYRDMGDIINAIKCLKKTLELDPSQPEIWEQLALLYKSVGSSSNCLRAYGEAKKEWCRISASWSRFMYAKKGWDYAKKALGYLERAQKIDPKKTEILLKKAELLERLKRFEEALEIYALVLITRPGDDELLSRKAGALKSLGLYEQAIEAYDQAINMRPDDWRLWFYRSEALIELMKLDEALESTEKCIEIGSVNNSVFGPYALYQRASIFAIKGDNAKALKDLAKAIILYKDELAIDIKSTTRKDIAFKNVWGDPEFKKITE